MTLDEVILIGVFLTLGMVIGAAAVWAHRSTKRHYPRHAPGSGECDGCGQISSHLQDGYCDWCTRIYGENN